MSKQRPIDLTGTSPHTDITGIIPLLAEFQNSQTSDDQGPSDSVPEDRELSIALENREPRQGPTPCRPNSWRKNFEANQSKRYHPRMSSSGALNKSNQHFRGPVPVQKIHFDLQPGQTYSSSIQRHGQKGHKRPLSDHSHTQPAIMTKRTRYDLDIARKDRRDGSTLNGTSSNPIQLDDDEDTCVPEIIRKIYPVCTDNDSAICKPIEEVLARIIPVIDLDGDEDSEESAVPVESVTDLTRLLDSTEFTGIATFERLPRDFQLLTLVDGLFRRSKRPTQSTEKRIPLRFYHAEGFRCAPDLGVELRDGSFVRIKSLYRNDLDEVFIAGWRLVRQNTLDLMMPVRRNEVVWLRNLTGKQTEEEVFECRVDEITKNRVIVFTNQQYPLMSFKDDGDNSPRPSDQDWVRPLFCRWKRNAVRETEDHTKEEQIEHLTAAEADGATRITRLGFGLKTCVKDQQKREAWRRVATMLGGSGSAVQNTIDLDDRCDTKSVAQYTFGDAFCGAGGTSRGALDAGLLVKWGFDSDAQAIGSYAENFAKKGTDCREEPVHQFITDATDDRFMVDVLHISPPCQPFSPAHTIPSPAKDEANQAALFSVWHLLEKVRPRVVTIEETAGLVSRHNEWFAALINIFICQGYSVKWKIIKCELFGVPQTRSRLFIIASGPGDKLPPFALPTHDRNNPRLKPLVTINDVLRHIPDNASSHDTTSYFKNGSRAPLPANRPAKTLTCNGGVGNYHPTGLRNYTVREAASLQTFPLYHSFAGAKGVVAARKQVGNAVPPVLAKAMFKTIVRSLMEGDEKEKRRDGRRWVGGELSRSMSN